MRQKTEAELTRYIKALAHRIASELPERLLKGSKAKHKATYRNRHRQSGIDEAVEQSYDQLDGEWHDWLEVARLYERKVPAQDRLDVRHNIMVELARARARDCEPIPLLRAYRIASLMVALYWREQNKASVKVCVLYGRPTVPDHKCSFVGKPSKCRECPFLAVRPIQSLDSEATDSEGNTVRLLDTVADDHAIDLDAWQDAKTFRLGCPLRLIEVAEKIRLDIPLDHKDREYLRRFRQREQKKLF